jgi:hypothetical protein
MKEIGIKIKCVLIWKILDMTALEVLMINYTFSFTHLK